MKTPHGANRAQIAQALESLGVIYFRCGDHERALVYALSAIRIGPVLPSQVNLAAAVFLELGRVKEAASVLSRYADPASRFSRPPSAAETRAGDLLRARVAHRQGQPGVAQELLDRALAGVPASETSCSA